MIVVLGTSGAGPIEAGEACAGAIALLCTPAELLLELEGGILGRLALLLEIAHGATIGGSFVPLWLELLLVTIQWNPVVADVLLLLDWSLLLSVVVLLLLHMLL